MVYLVKRYDSGDKRSSRKWLRETGDDDVTGRSDRTSEAFKEINDLDRERSERRESSARKTSVSSQRPSSSWKVAKPIKGTVAVTLEIAVPTKKSNGFATRVALREVAVPISVFDSRLPDSTVVRVRSARICDLVAEVPRDYADWTVLARVGGDTNDALEELGELKDVRSSKCPIQVQVHPSASFEDFFEVPLFLSRSKSDQTSDDGEDEAFGETESTRGLSSWFGGKSKKFGTKGEDDDAEIKSKKHGNSFFKRRDDDDNGKKKSKGRETEDDEPFSKGSKKHSDKSDNPKLNTKVMHSSRRIDGWDDDSDKPMSARRPPLAAVKKSKLTDYGSDSSTAAGKSQRKSSSGTGRSDSRSRRESLTVTGKSFGSPSKETKAGGKKKESSSWDEDENEDRSSRKSSRKREESASFFVSMDEDSTQTDEGKGKRRSENKEENPFQNGEDNEEDENDGEQEDEEPVRGRSGKKNGTRSLDGPTNEGEASGESDEDGSPTDADFRVETRNLAIKPWLGSIVAPSNIPPAKGDLPSETLVLEYAHGYRMREVNNNAFYLSKNTIVFPAGAVGVVMDLKSNTQKFFQGRHKEDVTAICVHPSRLLVATGDIVSHDDGAYIYVWDPRNPEDTHRQVSIRVGEKKLAKGVSDLEFSPDGKYLVATAMDDDHTVYFYDWQKAGKLIAKDKGHTDSIYGITFNPSTKSSYEFVTYGVKHLKHWTFNAGTLKGQRGIFGSQKSSSIICCTFLPNGSYVTGGQSGDVLFWNGNQVVNVVEGVHNGAVFSVLFNKDMGILTGGKDGVIMLHDPKTMDTLDKIELESGVRSIDWADGGSSILVGLEDSILLQVHGIGERGKKKIDRLIEGHSVLKGEEVWGCSVDPNNDEVYATSGDDSMVYKRNAKTCKILAKVRLQGKLRGIDYSPDSKYIAVGNDHGDLFMLRSDDLQQVHFEKYSKPKTIKSTLHAVEVLRFSPDGKYLAVGTHDDVIYIWEIGKSFKNVAICTGHHSYVTHVDWSSDSTTLQSNSADFEYLFWSIPSGKQITSAKSVKDVNWATFTCTIGWPTEGIWEKGMDRGEIHAVDRNPSRSCLASGDNLMNVKLHVYPAYKENMPYKKYAAHGSHVTKVLFTSKGKRLITTGGMDGITFQWRVEGGKSSSNSPTRRRQEAEEDKEEDKGEEASEDGEDDEEEQDD